MLWEGGRGSQGGAPSSLRPPPEQQHLIKMLGKQVLYWKEEILKPLEVGQFHLLLEGDSTGQSNVPGSSNRQTWAYIPALPLAAAGSQDTGLSHPQVCHPASVDYSGSYYTDFRVTNGYQPLSRLSNGKCSIKVSYFYHYVVGH